MFGAECRPCSVKETLEVFCSSDFVARGSISSIYNDARLERTLMTVRATRVIRQASAVFRPRREAASPSNHDQNQKRKNKKKWIAAPSKWKGMDGVEEDLTDVADVDDDLEHVATLHVPITCQVAFYSSSSYFSFVSLILIELTSTYILY